MNQQGAPLLGQGGVIHCLGICDCSQVLIASIIAEGIVRMSAFRRLSKSDVTDMAKRITGLPVTRGGARFGHMQINNVQALCHWVKERHSHGLPLDGALFDEDELENALDQLEVQSSRKETSTTTPEGPGKFKPVQWVSWWRGFTNWLGSLDGRNNAPLSYVVRKPVPALRRQGVPRAACNSLFGTLQRARHCISTGFGVSEPVYGGLDQDPPVQGSGQGSGKAPAIWAAISTVIISMMYAAGYGMEVLSCLTGILLRLVCFAFVDDTDTLQSAPSVEWSGEQVVPRIQAAVDCWEGSLWTSGGSIVPENSFWYLVDFRWTPKGWVYRSKEEMEGTLTVMDNQRNRIELRRLDPHEATTTLGVRMAMTGETTAQIEELRDKAQDLGESIGTAIVSKSDAWFTLQSSFFKTLEYPTVACTLSRKNWEYVMAPALKYALPKCGLARNFPRSVLFGPKSHQGLGLVHP